MRNFLLFALLVSALGSSVLNLRPNELQRSSSSSSSFDDFQVAESRKRSPEEKILHLRMKLKKRRQNEQQLQEELRNAKDELRDTKDELRDTKDELRGTKDELRGTKDELRGTNDELRNTKDELHNMTVDFLMSNGRVFVKAHELGCSVRQLNCDQKPVPKHRTPEYLQREVDAIPNNSMLYRPKTRESRANIEKIKKKCNEDIFGNPSSKAVVIPLAHLYSHSIQCRRYLADICTYFYGCDQNNNTISREKVFRFLFGFKTKPNTSGCLIHSVMLQRWNYIRLQYQGDLLDAKPQIFILPILQWLDQLCWDGYSGFCALFLTNSSDAYMKTGACNDATMLFWNNSEHKIQIMLALESFGDGCLDIISVQCSADIPETQLFENKICGQALKAIKSYKHFPVFNTSEIPEGAVFRMLTFKDGSAPNPTLLTMKSCNSLANLRFHQNAIPNLTCSSEEQAAIVVPGCFDVDEQGGSCPLCIDERVKEDIGFFPDSSEESQSHEELVRNVDALSIGASENEGIECSHVDTGQEKQTLPFSSGSSPWSSLVIFFFETSKCTVCTPLSTDFFGLSLYVISCHQSLCSC